MLLEKGKSLEAVSTTGLTALRYTIEQVHGEVENLLRVKMYDLRQSQGHAGTSCDRHP